MGWHTIDAKMEEACRRFITGSLDYEIEGCSVYTRFSNERVELPAIKIYCEDVQSFPEGARFNGNWQGQIMVRMSTYWNEDAIDETVGHKHDQRVSEVTDLFSADNVATQLNALMPGELIIISDVQIMNRTNAVEDNKLVTTLALDFIAGPQDE